MVEVPLKVLAILPAFIPSTMICIIKPLLQLHRNNYITTKISLESLASSRNLEWADLVIFCRNTEPRYAYIMDILQNKNIPFIFDLDDNFFELPLNTDEGRYHRQSEHLEMVTNYIRRASLVRVYSDPLKHKAETLNQKVEKVFGPIDLNLIQPGKIEVNSNIVKLVYATSRIHDEISALFTPALKQILKEYAGRIECHFWGPFLHEFKGYRGVYNHTPIQNYNRFIELFSRSGYDIGLAPLPDDLFHRSKSNNKFREYGACRIAGIYSDMEVYSTCVKHGETGLLVSNKPEAWYQAIVKLIEDRDLREKIKRQAQEYVIFHYSQEQFERIWWDQIQKVISENPIPLTQARQIIAFSAPKGFLTIKFQKFKRIIRSQGWRAAINVSRWSLFGLWMSLKIPFQLHFISVSNVFNRKRTS
jgi:glycosyltransferase involved in cell wall biosynthesis